MRLKRIRLAGFKSFVDPTNIDLPGSMTAIVGPNGCGKSNVIDAVRWVLGESSAKNLRGDAMTDVIFNGSTSRKPVGQCSVELMFDNTDQRLVGEYANYAEVSIKRVVTRDAQSLYYLNGSKCRRRDVTDLFLGTGLGPRSYAIIEQGMISRLIESKPQELRVFIEEAAGISRYKERRRETETRIRHTQENLERLQDVRLELASQLQKLERQAAAANRYTSLKADERRLKAELAVIRWKTLQRLLDEQLQQHQQAMARLEQLQQQQGGDDSAIQLAEAKVIEAQQEVEELQHQRFDVESQIARIEQDKKYTDKRRQQLSEELAQLAMRKHSIETSLKETTEDTEGYELRLEALRPEVEVLQERLLLLSDEAAEAEQRSRQAKIQWEQQAQTVSTLQQQMHLAHGKLASLINGQERTEQRLAEISAALSALDETSILNELTLLQQECEQLALTRLALEESRRVHEQDLEETLQQLNIIQREKEALLTEKMTLDANREALVNVQSRLERENDIPEWLSPLWSVLQVKTGYESCVEGVLSALGQPLISREMSLSMLRERVDDLPKGHFVISNDGWTSEVKAGSVAEYLSSHRVPTVFNDIALPGDSHHADSQTERCPQQLGQDALIFDGGIWTAPSAAQQGMLERARQIQLLSQHIVEVGDKLDSVQTNFAVVDEKRKQQEMALKAVVLDVDALRQQQAENKSKRDLVEFQQRTLITQREKLSQERMQQQQLLQQEREQMEMINEQILQLEDNFAEQQERAEAIAATREKTSSQLASCRQQAEAHQQQCHQLTLQIQQLEHAKQRLLDQLSRNREQLIEIEQSVTEKEAEQRLLTQPVDTQAAQLQALLERREAIESSLHAAHVHVKALNEECQQLRQSFSNAGLAIQQQQQRLSAIEIEIERYRLKCQTQLDVLSSLQVTIKAVMETLPDGADEASWQSSLDQVQASLQRLGAVNLTAVSEYEQQAQRKAALDAQFEDLSQAMDILQDAIRKIDRETRTRFSQTFDAVNRDLQHLFPKVFGGGAAYLALTDEDLLETGVTIMARPPGKKNSTIHLLSGGEKALTALSLVFAIFKLNPAPFCMLDEVDAPLDDANVGRFCNLVAEMSSTVQFVFITHNKVAMEMATHLMGVTMSEPGVSRLVSVDVDAAMSIVQS